MTELVYLTDSYLKELETKVVSCEQKGKIREIVLEKTIFYPQGGGQPSDIGDIICPSGKAKVKHVRMKGADVVHECTLDGSVATGQEVMCQPDWNFRYLNMRRHSAGHIVHEAVMQLSPEVKPLRADHGKQLFVEYSGSLPIDKKYEVEKLANEIVQKNLPLKTEMVSYEELTKRVSYIAGTLPKNKPLRILTVGDFSPIPDGGTQVKATREAGEITVTLVENDAENVRVYYSIEEDISAKGDARKESLEAKTISTPNFIGQLLDL
ncbi:alanyl-tRNA editing protein, partial [Patescibacteria group bacterium]|nr:alanyl-tRNA editing protein [Patescibacteria group bacterium]